MFCVTAMDIHPALLRDLKKRQTNARLLFGELDGRDWENWGQTETWKTEYLVTINLQ